MADLNRCIFTGRLVKDPVLEKSKSGKSVVNTTLAIDSGLKTEEGKGIANFVDIQIWNKPAETIAQYSAKGDRLAFECEVRTTLFTDKETGKTRKNTTFVAERFTFLTSKRNSEAVGDSEEVEYESFNGED